MGLEDKSSQGRKAEDSENQQCPRADIGSVQSPDQGGVTADMRLCSNQTGVNGEITEQFIAAGNFACAVEEKFESPLYNAA